MRQPDGALSLVNVLAAGAAGTKGIDRAFAQQVFVGFWQQDHVRYAVLHPQITQITLKRYSVPLFR